MDLLNRPNPSNKKCTVDSIESSDMEQRREIRVIALSDASLFTYGSYGFLFCPHLVVASDFIDRDAFLKQDKEEGLDRSAAESAGYVP